MQGGSDLGSGWLVRVGKLGFGSWVNAIKRCTRGGGFGLKIENRAVGLGFRERNAGGSDLGSGGWLG